MNSFICGKSFYYIILFYNKGKYLPKMCKYTYGYSKIANNNVSWVYGTLNVVINKKIAPFCNIL